MSNDLEGIWDVERRGGLLPPLAGVTKRIRDGRGETRVGRLVGVPFEVVGDELRYSAPFRGFVDRVRPDDQGFAGTAMFRGRTFGHFVLRRRR